MNKSTINLLLNILIVLLIMSIVYISMVPSHMNIFNREKFNQSNNAPCPIGNGLTEGDRGCKIMFAVDYDALAVNNPDCPRKVPSYYNDPCLKDDRLELLR